MKKVLILYATAGIGHKKASMAVKAAFDELKMPDVQVTLADALDLALWCLAHHLQPEQIQDFIPLPRTLSGAMYYTSHDSVTGTAIAIPTGRQRRLQRALLQYRAPANRKLIYEALDILKRPDLKKAFTRHYG